MHRRINAEHSRLCKELTVRSNMGVPPGCCTPSLPPPLGGKAFEESQLTRRLSFSNWSMDSCRTRPLSEPAESTAHVVTKIWQLVQYKRPSWSHHGLYGFALSCRP